MIIRSSLDKDISATIDLHQEAFDESEADSVARLVVDLFQDVTAQPLISLVATVDGMVTGDMVSGLAIRAC